MARRKKVDPFTAELDKLIQDGKIIIGTDETLKGLRQGTLAKVFVSQNCPDNVREDLATYCNLGDVECIDIPYPNDELGTMCRKPFAISVIGVTK